MSKPRAICFTLNNFIQAEITHINNGSFKFIIYQQETGAGGTPHLQGYAQQSQPTSFKRWKELIGTRAHLEAAKGDAAANIAYCSKQFNSDGSIARIPGSVVFESGSRPSQGERKDLIAITDAARDVSIPIADILNIDAPNFLRFYRGVFAIRSLLAPPRNSPTIVCWFYGGTGVGKTRRAAELYPGAYWKQNSDWWCGYDPTQHHTVIIDEYRCNFSTFSFLLQLFDRYPLKVQIKGGNVEFCARRIVVTSPKSPSETWSSRTVEDIQQLLRRITVVGEFLRGGIVRYTKGSELDLIDVGVEESVESVGVVAVAPREIDQVPVGIPSHERTVRPRTGPVLADEPPGTPCFGSGYAALIPPNEVNEIALALGIDPPVGTVNLSQSSFLNDFDYDSECGNAFNNDGRAYVEHFNI